MPDLILLCAGAASDRAPFDGLSPLHAAPLIERLRDGAFSRRFRQASVISDHMDPSALPLETPDETFLRSVFGLPEADAVEAWSAAHAGLSTPVWLAGPCHIQVGRDQLMLTDPEALALTPEEARSLAQAVADLFSSTGFRLEVADPLRWYLTGNPDWALTARSRAMAIGRSIDGYLPQGPRARDWRRLFTETQITWHEHPVNLARQARGARTVNALWLDGCARGPLHTTPGLMVAEHPALLGLARAGGWQVLAAPWSDVTTARLEALAAQAGGGPMIIDVSAWRNARRRGDPADWEAAWIAFDRWLRALGAEGGAGLAGGGALRAVLTGERRRLELRCGAGLTWRFWRRIDALGTVLAP